MTQRRTLEFLVEASLVLGGVNLSAEAQQRPVPEERPLFLPDVSPSPLNPPSRDKGQAAARSAQLACLFFAVDAFERYTGPAEARQFAEGAFFMSCVLKEMPAGWPDGAVIQRHAAELAGRARQADPGIDPCLLTACIVGRRITESH